MGSFGISPIHKTQKKKKKNSESKFKMCFPETFSYKIKRQTHGME